MAVPANDFDPIAPVYDALAGLVFGGAQQRAQQQFLHLVPEGARVLVLGGGSGRLLTELLQRSAPSHVLYLEASATMLRQARKRVGNRASTCSVEFRLGTQQDLLPTERFHVVLTPFVLDLFTPPEVAQILQKVDAALLPRGLWLHTDFHLSAGGPNRGWQRLLLWMMYRFFRRVSGISGRVLPPFDQLFRQAGLQLQEEAYFYRSFIRAQVFQKSTFISKESQQ